MGMLGLHRTNPANFLEAGVFVWGFVVAGTCTGHTQNGRCGVYLASNDAKWRKSTSRAHGVLRRGKHQRLPGTAVGCTQTSHKSGTCTGLPGPVSVWQAWPNGAPTQPKRPKTRHNSFVEKQQGGREVVWSLLLKANGAKHSGSKEHRPKQGW